MNGENGKSKTTKAAKRIAYIPIWDYKPTFAWPMQK